ncbi:hypothetical protein LSAT2_030111 [Lamellibrachia satsuma]|nr:hypothetical protein LSAT2_030111 [Lamellibrachia satsuma]
MSRSRKMPAAASGPSDVDDVIQGKGLMDKGFLMKLAQHTLSSTEQFQLGVFLKVKTSEIQDLMRASQDAVINTFTILETWIDSRHDVGNVTALFDQLSGACLNIKRADMVEFVRCEQLQLLNEKLKRAKETAQSCKTRSNEQMRLVKVELRETKDELQEIKEELRKSNDLLRLEQSKHQTSEDEVRRLNELVTRSGNQEKATAVKGESDKDRKFRALHVMSLLRGYGQLFVVELWGHVSQHFVEEGQLDLSEVLSSTNLPDLVYLLQSGAASDVTNL